MKLLIVSATEMEVGLLQQHLATAASHDVSLLVAGVGQLATAYALTKHLMTNKYDLVLQAGVGGCFDINIPPGEVVFVTSECYGDLGAEDHDSYLDIFDMGLIQPDVAPHNDGRLINETPLAFQRIKLRQVSGLTVNQVSGNAKTIAHLKERYNCTVESMEGAAFHYVCLQEKVPFAQVRAISNYVIPRDKSQWQMKEAVIALNNWLIAFISGEAATG